MTVRARELRVASDERRIQRLGERDIGAVIRSDRIPQLPNAWHEVVVSVPVYDEGGAVVESQLSAGRADFGELHEAPQRLRDLHVEQVRRVEVLVRREYARRHIIGQSGSEQKLEQGRGVDDDHRPSRSARTILVGDVLPW